MQHAWCYESQRWFSTGAVIGPLVFSVSLSPAPTQVFSTKQNKMRAHFLSSLVKKKMLKKEKKNWIVKWTTFSLYILKSLTKGVKQPTEPWLKPVRKRWWSSHINMHAFFFFFYLHLCFSRSTETLQPSPPSSRSCCCANEGRVTVHFSPTPSQGCDLHQPTGDASAALRPLAQTEKNNKKTPRI